MFSVKSRESRRRRDEREAVNARKTQPRARREARIIIANTSFISGRCRVHSRPSCRCESFRISISAVSFPRYLLSLSRHVISTSVCSSSSDGTKFRTARDTALRDSPWDSYSAEYVMRNRLRWDGRAKERNECFRFNVRVCVCHPYACTARRARSENSKQLEGNLIIKHRPYCLPSRSLSVK